MSDPDAGDFISDLPQSIVESILTRLPIRDAVRTSILSRKWRYRWTGITDLVFDDRCVSRVGDRASSEIRMIKFITQTLLLHQGPIHKFRLCTSRLESCAAIDQWILFLSRNDIKELILELGEGDWFKVPTCLFNSKKLTRLELFRCELDPPPTFSGFPCLKCLNLHQVCISPEAVETLISGCPLLENLALSYFDSLSLKIQAPNLKYLCLEGEFTDIRLEDTPLLVGMLVAMYMTDDIAERFEQSSSCNFAKVLGGVPRLERLIGHIYFTKYLSIGDDLRRPAITYNHLKIIELYQVSFEDLKEIGVVLQLINSSPNLKEFHISGSSNASSSMEEPHSAFWTTEGASNCSLKQLKVVKMTDISAVPNEMEFIKYMLAKSPALEVMSIASSVYATDEKLRMMVGLLKFPRASPKAEIQFVKD